MNDREYGPAGQLLAVHSSKGTTRYEYDPEGNLVRKIEPNGKVWKYEWNGAGHMAKVIRPDGQEIRFEYDALGRRIQKIVGNKTTHWVWDGNNPLHEWVDYKPTTAQTINAQNTRQQDANADTAKIATRDALSTVLDHQGPPSGKARFNEGTQAQPITWLFEPDSFTPMAKLVGDEHYSIITDHLGTPNTVFDKDGKPVWSADISVWGELRNLHGDKDFCPFRYPGQYEDSETGLYYNRFRYYDPEAGRYVSQDPINLAGGMCLYGYVNDPLQWIDPLGLSRSKNGKNNGIDAGSSPSCGASIANTSSQAKKFGPHEHGPLGDPNDLKSAASTFRSGSYVEKVADANTKFYRDYGGNARIDGRFWTPEPSVGPLQSQMDSAVLPEWGNTFEKQAVIKLPPGTKYYEGPAAPQKGTVGTRPELHGGGVQIFLPDIDKTWITEI